MITLQILFRLSPQFHLTQCFRTMALLLSTVDIDTQMEWVWQNTYYTWKTAIGAAEKVMWQSQPHLIYTQKCQEWDNHSNADAEELAEAVH